MELLFDHLNACAEKLVKKLYNSKQLSLSGSPKLKWDWSHIRVRGSSGATGSYSKSYGVTQNEFTKRLRTEEEICRLKMPKVARAKPSAMKNLNIQPVGWETLMSLVDNMPFWRGAGAQSPAKKRTRVDKKGE